MYNSYNSNYFSNQSPNLNSNLGPIKRRIDRSTPSENLTPFNNPYGVANLTPGQGIMLPDHPYSTGWAQSSQIQQPQSQMPSFDPSQLQGMFSGGQSPNPN
jgi:hypothetical protein